MTADLVRTIRCGAAGAASARACNLAAAQRRSSASGLSQALPAKLHSRRIPAKQMDLIRGPIYTVRYTSPHAREWQAASGPCVAGEPEENALRPFAGRPVDRALHAHRRPRSRPHREYLFSGGSRLSIPSAASPRLDHLYLVLMNSAGAPPLPPLTANQIRSFLAAWGGWALDGMDSFIYALVLIPALKDLLPRSGIPGTPANIGFYGGLLFAMFLVGWGLAFLWGPVGDRFGRVRTLTLTILCYSLFTFLGSVFDLRCTSCVLDVFSSDLLVGWGLAFLWGPVGDRFGRVRTLTLTILCYSLFTFLGAVSASVWQLGRFAIC